MFYILCACATAAGAGRAAVARPAGRMQDQHVVDRATPRAVVYQMQPGSRTINFLTLFIPCVQCVGYIFYAFLYCLHEWVKGH